MWQAEAQDALTNAFLFEIARTGTQQVINGNYAHNFVVLRVDDRKARVACFGHAVNHGAQWFA